MSESARRALQHETDFLSGVEANFESAKGRHFRGSLWRRVMQDDSDRLRALLAENRIYDRELLKDLPANRRVALHGFERRFLFWKRQTGVAVASVLSPLGYFASSGASGGSAPAIGLGELAEHVRKLVGDARVPHVVGVCSPTGFTDEARRSRLEMPNVTLVLIEPDGTGGWRTSATSESIDDRILRMFDPEGAKQKIGRVRRVIEEHSASLLTGGLSASSVARKVNLPENVVREALTELTSSDSELRVSKRDGEFFLFRGAPQELLEKKPMNVIDRIRQLFAGGGHESEKINVLAERRAALAQRRDRIYEDIAKLEKTEADLLEQGKAAKSEVPKRRLAAQLAQLRKDIARQNTTAAMLNQQINIISTDIHNLTLIRQGEMAKLPDTAELTENAVRAEELLESLKADNELVGNLSVGMQDITTSEEELEILREFESAPAEPAKTTQPAERKREPIARQPAAEEPPAPSRPASDRARKAEPEAT